MKEIISFAVGTITLFYKHTGMYTGEVFCNGEKMDAMETFAEEDCSCTYDFAMNGHKGRIVTRDGAPNTLTVDGMLVPN